MSTLEFTTEINGVPIIVRCIINDIGDPDRLTIHNTIGADITPIATQAELGQLEEEALTRYADWQRGERIDREIDRNLAKFYDHDR